MLDKLYKYAILSTTGGLIYSFIEIAGRGYTHWSMFLLGGLCFVLLGLLNEIFSWSTPLLLQMLCGAVIITTLEFMTGCIVNLWLRWNVWDYSNEPFNFYGQICLKYSCYWFWLSLVGILLDDYLRYWLFQEEKPRYKIL